ncbi:hypothetical protein [Nitrosomonas cryotolerans]|uniref:Uncharacterized protein n=1 Tax=Nitrosomonas cryotolerans ATCC 49181 TaxID=1131553 RepID=A0A1N6JXW3_9PROT|nr:hypothetical protein [Nitrosomonas cryotolerans]SIO49178.1 hypothetical protein SAMN02743940_0023 [Nitrosomonas cryotolerans ATCC 49181]
MSSKTIGLAAFTKKGTADIQQTSDDQGGEPIGRTHKRGRGKGEVVALTIRFSRADWERVHQLAVSEGVSIQHLAISGISKIFEEKGLAGLKL